MSESLSVRSSPNKAYLKYERKVESLQMFDAYPELSTVLDLNPNDIIQAETLKENAIREFNEKMPKGDRLQIGPDMKFNDVLSEAQIALRYVCGFLNTRQDFFIREPAS
jgi:hypothetical protein